MSKKTERINFLDYLDKKNLLYSSEKAELENLREKEIVEDKELARRIAIKEYKIKDKDKDKDKKKWVGIRSFLKCKIINIKPVI